MHILIFRVAIACLLFLPVAGCGTTLPVIDYQHPDGTQFNDFVNSITTHVRCELAQAVYREVYPPQLPGARPVKPDKKRSLIPTWAAKIALTIRAVDKGQFNPNLSVFNKAVTFAFAAGAQLEADGTREMTMTYFITFDELLAHPGSIDTTGRFTPCETNKLEPIADDLNIYSTLDAALYSWDGLYTFAENIKGGEPVDTITHHVTFILMAEASATPTWKFVRVSADTNGNLFSGTRTHTNDLLITMGPLVLGTKKATSELNTQFNTERLGTVINNRL